MRTLTDKQLTELYRYWTVRDLREALACDPLGPNARAEIKRVLILRGVDPATITGHPYVEDGEMRYPRP